jgi:LAGLIDADG DNA endonuclease family protein
MKNNIKIPYWQSTKCPLRKRGIPPKYTHMSNEEKQQMITLYETGEYTYTDIAIKYSRDLSSVQAFFNKNGYKAKPQTLLQRKYNINEDFFDNIDTESKAYILGFLYADGYNNYNNYEITINISSKDEILLKRILSEMKSNIPIKYTKVNNGVKEFEYSKVSIGNKKISTRLNELGCVQAKSHILIFPNWLNPLLYHHFIRGYFDGDGSIMISKKIPSNMNFSITGSKLLLTGIQDILVKQLNFNKIKIYPASKSKETIGVIIYSGRNNLKTFRDWIYNDATIYLDRKYSKFQSI